MSTQLSEVPSNDDCVRVAKIQIVDMATMAEKQKMMQVWGDGTCDDSYWPGCLVVTLNDLSITWLLTNGWIEAESWQLR